MPPQEAEDFRSSLLTGGVSEVCSSHVFEADDVIGAEHGWLVGWLNRWFHGSLWLVGFTLTIEWLVGWLVGWLAGLLARLE